MISSIVDVPFPHEYKNCALIGGSSDLLLGRNFSSEIDAHELVIRFNRHFADPRYSGTVTTHLSGNS